MTVKNNGEATHESLLILNHSHYFPILYQKSIQTIIFSPKTVKITTSKCIPDNSSLQSYLNSLEETPYLIPIN